MRIAVKRAVSCAGESCDESCAAFGLRRWEDESLKLICPLSLPAFGLLEPVRDGAYIVVREWHGHTLCGSLIPATARVGVAGAACRIGYAQGGIGCFRGISVVVATDALCVVWPPVAELPATGVGDESSSIIDESLPVERASSPTLRRSAYRSQGWR